MLAAEVAERSRDVDPARLVYYAEVRPDTELRDVLVGLSFHLHRWGLTEPFAKSVEIGPPDEEVIAKLAKLYSSLNQPILLVVDLVQGSSSERFARELASFIRALSTSSVFRLAVLGQESALRALTQLERDQYAVGQVDVRGFRFEEFFSLVAQNHSSAVSGWNQRRLPCPQGVSTTSRASRSVADAELTPNIQQVWDRRLRREPNGPCCHHPPIGYRPSWENDVFFLGPFIFF
jgi:hypothetical protein